MKLVEYFLLAIEYENNYFLQGFIYIYINN